MSRRSRAGAAEEPASLAVLGASDVGVDASAAATGEPPVVAGIAYLNARPLLAGLEAGIPAPFTYRFERAEPGACATRLAAGAAVAALVPVATLPSLGQVHVDEHLGVACRGRVTSVLLLSRVPLERIATLAVHRASRSSVSLARLLLAERYGVRPRLVHADPPLVNMLERADASVIIGDPALHEGPRTGLLKLDLGEEWHAWTGLPFVFAVWAVTPSAPAGIADLLERSHQHALSRWQELVPRWARAHGHPEPVVREYLERILHFRLDERDRAGMAEFLARAKAACVLPTDVAGF